MITKQQAIDADIGHVFHHISIKNSSFEPVRCRKNGKVKVWKTRPEEFKMPVKHGLYDHFYITENNAGEWNL